MAREQMRKVIAKNLADYRKTVHWLEMHIFSLEERTEPTDATERVLWRTEIDLCRDVLKRLRGEM
jgi:hypothetical protein